MGTIKDLIKQMSDPGVINTQVATITSVDEDNCSCEAKLLDGIELFDVNLKSIIDNKKGIVCIPKVNSKVLVGYINNDSKNAFVVAFDELDKVTVECDSIIINKGDNKGMVKLPELVDKLNSIEQDLNTLKNVFSSWVVAPNDGGGALKGAAASWFGNVLSTTTESDLENAKIKH